MASYKEPVLHQPIEELPFSREFKTTTEILGFHTLSELLQHHTGELEELPGFTVLLIHEYISFMEKKSLGHHIDPA